MRSIPHSSFCLVARSVLCLSGSLCLSSGSSLLCRSLSSSGLSSLCSLFLSLGSSLSSLLVGHLLGNSLVNSLLCLQCISSSILLGLSLCLSDLSQTVLLVSLPGLELLLGSSLDRKSVV